ncbi:MAG: tetratricopeptide repeat protein [Gammaproteobacteria bacterium]|nr:MAG: tetratricopeptide repeat protein [Gammaproteobacteria bacterium]
MPSKPRIEEIAHLIRDGDTRLARERLDSLGAANSADGCILDLEAELCLQERRSGDALRAAEQAIRHGREDVGRLIRRGRALNNLGRLDEAERDFRAAIRLDQQSADAHASLGHVLRRLQRTDDAESSLRRALELNPHHLPGLRSLGMMCIADGRSTEAVTLFGRAIDLAPADAGLAGQLGVALHNSGELSKAADVYRGALELDESQVQNWLNLGITLQDLGHLEEAISAYEQASRLAPSRPAPLHRLAEALLAAGRCEEALKETERAMELDPCHPSTISTRIIAAQRLGKDAESRRLLALDSLISEQTLPTPDGYRDKREFHGALVDHVMTHPTLTYEPGGHATRRGRHTRNLLQGDKGPIGLLEQGIIQLVDRYLETVSPPPGHPFPGDVPRPHRLTMWAVVMDTEGHQLPHIHPAAWLSGVYYVELPRTLGKGGDDVAGWIEFGLAPEELQHTDETPVRLFRPAEGSVYLFPSFLYHRTIPFGGEGRRISIAFDVLRRPAG